MNTKFLQIFLILFFSNFWAQNIEKLDNNFGFRKFKFGTDISQIKNIKNNNSKFNNMDEYIYEGNDITDIQNVKISRINLYFLNKKLAAIFIAFGWENDYNSEQFSQVTYGLENSFGKPTASNCKGEVSLLNCNIWMGKKVKLEHTRSRTKDNYLFGLIMFEELNMRQKRINSDF